MGEIKVLEIIERENRDLLKFERISHDFSHIKTVEMLHDGAVTIPENDVEKVNNLTLLNFYANVLLLEETLADILEKTIEVGENVELSNDTFLTFLKYTKELNEIMLNLHIENKAFFF